MGEDEIAAFRTFVKDGGVLVADQRPDGLSGHIRPISNGPADGLFGIKRSGPGKVGGSTLSGVKVLGVDVSLGAVAGDTQIEPADVTPLATVDGLPLLIQNHVGRGMVWLLNTSFAGYAPVRDVHAGEPWRRLFTALAGQAQLAQPAAMAARSDGTNPLTRLVQWERGGVRLFGLLDGIRTTVTQFGLECPHNKRPVDNRE